MTDTAPATSAPVEINAVKLRELRQEQGLTQQDLAARCGVSAAYISQLEIGYRRRVSPPLYVRLAEALQIAPENRPQLRQNQPKVAD